jgi:hypothetical protein
MEPQKRAAEDLKLYAESCAEKADVRFANEAAEKRLHEPMARWPDDPMTR